MNTRLNPYILFNNGDARKAMEFYKTVFGGELTLTTYKEGGAPHDELTEEHIMHGMLVSENGIVLMGSDDTDKHDPSSSHISLSLSGEDEEELRGYWNKLIEGGKVTMDMSTAPWGDTFGMCEDPWGTRWMVNITKAKAA